MSLFGRVFGKVAAAEDQEDDAEVENLLHQISDARHASERRDAMSQLRDLLQDNPRAQLAMGTMGLPVVLSVLQEDRDDLELLKGALEVLHCSVNLPEPLNAGQQPWQRQAEEAPHPALINADLFCRTPDNVLLLLGLLRDEPEGVDDFYVRYGTLQALGALMAACPDKLQGSVLSSPLGVVALMDLLASPLEVLRNEALLLLVGLCSNCPQIANIAAFEGAFDKLLVICGADGGPGSGDVVIQDAAELMNNLLRDNVANQRLFREMGHINQLPPLLQFTPIHTAALAAPPPPAAAGGGGGSLLNAATAAAAAAGNTAAAAVASASAGAWPMQVAANYLCLLETARLLLAAPHAAQEEQRAQEESNRRANQDKLSQLGLLPLLTRLAAEGGGAPAAAVRAQGFFCLGDLISGHAQLQEQLAGILISLPVLTPAALLPHQQQQQQQGGSSSRSPPAVPLLQLALQIVLRGPDELERAGALHLLQAFCYNNHMGQLALMSTVAVSDHPQTFGEELLAALLCQQPTQTSNSSSSSSTHQPPWGPPSSGRNQGLPIPSSGLLTTPGLLTPVLQPLDLQLIASRAAAVLGFFLDQNPDCQKRLLGLVIQRGNPSDMIMPRLVKLLGEVSRRADGRALPVCYNMLRLLITWCCGCSAAVSALLVAPNHLALLVDLVGGRMPGGDVHTAGLAAILLGVCLMNATGSPLSQQQQQQQQSVRSPPPAAAAGGIHFSQLLDVLLSRVGLSQFFGAIDDMRNSKAFQAAAAAPRLPAHITRSAAAAMLDSESGGVLSSSSSSKAGAFGLLSGVLTAAAGAAADGTSNAAAAAADAHQPYDHAFTWYVNHVTAAVQQLTLDAFSGGAGAPSPGNAAAATAPWQQQQQQQSAGALGQGPPQAAAAASGVSPPVGAVLPPPPPFQQQQQGPAAAGVLAPPAAAAAAGSQDGSRAPPAFYQPQPQQQQQQYTGDLAHLAAQLPGQTAEEKLQSALQMISQLQGTCTELQNRNKSLAEDLIRLSQAKPHVSAAAADGGSSGDGSIVANGYTAANGTSAAAAVSGPKSSDAESRVALQLRASRAELEAGAMRQQLSAMQEQWRDLELQVTAANAAADEARAAAAKAEADLSELSTAYNSLEAHAFEVEEQLKQSQQQQPTLADTAVTTAAADGVSNGSGSATAAVVDPDVIEQRIAAAVAEARQEAAAEAEGEMEDLLACLGEEQAKVELLSTKLIELGEDVDELLLKLAADEEECCQGGSQEAEAELL